MRRAMMCDCCSLRGFSGVGMAVRALHFSAVKFVVRLSAPVPRGRNHIGMSLASICSRRGHEGLLCKFSAAFISVAIVAVTVVAFPWPAPSADAATSDLSVPLGETSAQISYVRNTEGSDTVTDLAGGYYYSALPWQWAAARACIRYSPAGGDYSTSVVKGGAAEPTPPSATGARSSAGAVRTSRETPPGAVSPPWGSSPPTPRPSKPARFFLSE